MTKNAVPDSIVSETSVAAGPDFIKVPLVLSRNQNISPSAKLVYGRLVLYKGKDGKCNPSHETLASEVGLKQSRVREVLLELRDYGLIDWKRTRTSSNYIVNSPACCQSAGIPANKNAGKPTSKIAGIPATKRGSLKRGSVKDVDIDCPLPKAKRADALPAQHPRIKNTLARYRSGGSAPKPEHFPSDSMVAEIVHAAGDCGEDWIVGKLYFLHNELGLRWGAQNGPRAWRWFITVLAERAEREDALYRGRAPENIWDCDGTRQVQ